MVWKRGVQENIVILNVAIFCDQTKVFGNIKFSLFNYYIISELNSNIFSAVLQ